MKIKEAKENVIKNFRANHQNNPNVYNIEVFLLNTMENIQMVITSGIRKGLLKESTIGTNTLAVFDKIIKKI